MKLSAGEEAALAQYLSRFPPGDIRLRYQLYQDYHHLVSSADVRCLTCPRGLSSSEDVSLSALLGAQAPAHTPDIYRTHYLTHRSRFDSLVPPCDSSSVQLHGTSPEILSANTTLKPRDATSSHLSSVISAADESRHAPSLRTPSNDTRHDSDSAIRDSSNLDTTPADPALNCTDSIDLDNQQDLANDALDNADIVSISSLSSGSSEDCDLLSVLEGTEKRLKACYTPTLLDALRKMQDEFKEIGKEASADEIDRPLPSNSHNLMSQIPRPSLPVPENHATISPEASRASMSRSVPSESSNQHSPVRTSPRIPSAHLDDGNQSDIHQVLESAITEKKCVPNPTRTIPVGPRNIPSGPLSIESAQRLMAEFMSDFGTLFCQSDATRLFGMCGDWGSMFEVGFLMYKAGSLLFEKEQRRSYLAKMAEPRDQAHFTKVMGTLWDDEDDRLLRTPTEKLSVQEQRQLQMIEIRQGLRRVTRRRRFLQALDSV